jgi:hypothetical protein
VQAVTDDNIILELFQPLYADLRPENSFENKRPLLAHYTTVGALEKILAKDELWFSNPLFMNDFEEVRFGVLTGMGLIMNSDQIASACLKPERAQIFREALTYYFNEFNSKHVLDTYVFCLSEHAREDNDGLLSMWRGYGGNGNGVAIVFDASQFASIPTSPLIVAEVEYGTVEARRDWLLNLLAKFADIVRRSSIPDDKLHVAAFSLFERIKLFALFTKHWGFKEEKEWRVVYMPDRDKQKRLTPMFHYFVGNRGVELKLKFKVAHIDGVTQRDLSLTKITERIILGPSIASPTTYASVIRMFEVLGHPDLKSKLRTSNIPFRAIG